MNLKPGLTTMTVHDIKNLDLSPIFFGNPRCEQHLQELHRLLDDAAEHISGLQQPGHPETEAQAKEEEEAYRRGNEHVAFNLYIIVRRLGAEKLVREMLNSTEKR